MIYFLLFLQLSVQFLQGTSAPQSCWTMVGIGIRLAQDVGAHRRKTHKHELTAEVELWKRAFWFAAAISRLTSTELQFRVLIFMDRMVSASLGRPCAIQDEEYVNTIYVSAFSLIHISASTSTYLLTVTTSTGITQIQPNVSSSLQTNLQPYPRFSCC